MGTKGSKDAKVDVIETTPANINISPRSPRSVPYDPAKWWTWNADDTCNLLNALSLSQYASTFKENGVDGLVISSLDDDSLKNDLGITNGIHRKKIINAITEIIQTNPKPSSALSPVLSSNKIAESRDGILSPEQPPATPVAELKPSNTFKEKHITFKEKGPKKESDFGLQRTKSLRSKMNYKLLHRNRTVRIFVSSTFRDFALERDYLFQFIFPELEKKCVERGVFFIPVDLRWGLTAEESGSGEVVRLCLQEIDACRPFFLGMLGDRYGWHMPPGGKDELLEKTIKIGTDYFPWVADYSDRSATELEIRHAVLNDPTSMIHHYFYFRHPNFPESLPPNERSIYYSETPHAAKLQKALKNEIKEAIDPSRLMENYQTVEEFGARVLQNFSEAIDIEFPPNTNCSELDKTRDQHKSFAETRLRTFVGKPEQYTSLDNAILRESRPTVLTGESGVGKTALIANWIQSFKRKHNEVIIIQHYIGCTAESITISNIAWRIMAECIDKLSIQNYEIPSDTTKRINCLGEFLEMAGEKAENEKKYIILVLDGLHQLENTDTATTLSWLPRILHPGIRILSSTLEGPALVAWRERKWREQKLEPLDQECQKEIVTEYLGNYGKRLSDEQLNIVIEKDQTKNALFLQTLLNEIRTFGSFELLVTKIQHYLEAQNTYELFGKVLERLEGAYGTTLVKDTMCLIYCSREGITEDELLRILQIPRAGNFTAFRLATQEHLCNRSAGLLGFFHDSLQQAVKYRYLENHSDISYYHTELAEFFLKESQDGQRANRQSVELPYQLEYCQRWNELSRYLSKLSSFKILSGSENGNDDLCHYWRRLMERGISPALMYKESLSEYEIKASNTSNIVQWLISLGDFLENLLLYKDALLLYERALEMMKANGDNETLEIGSTLKRIANLYNAQGDLSKAANLYKESQKVFESIKGETDPEVQRIIGNLANILRIQGKFSEALPLYEKVVYITEKTLGKNHIDVATHINNVANILRELGRHEEALELYKKSLEITEKFRGVNHIDCARTLHNMGLSKRNLGQHQEALEMMEKALQILEKGLGKDHPEVGVIVGNIGITYTFLKENEKALPLLERSLEINKKIYGDLHPKVAGALGNLARMYEMLQKFDKAKELYMECLNVTEKTLGSDNPNMCRILGNLGRLNEREEKWKEAIEYYEKGYAIGVKCLGDNHRLVVDIKKALDSLKLISN